MISHRTYTDVSCEFLCLLDSSSRALITTLHDVSDAAADAVAVVSCTQLPPPLLCVTVQQRKFRQKIFESSGMLL